MLNAIGDSLSDLASLEHQEDEEDEDDDKADAGHGKLSEDDDPGWVMGTSSQMVQHWMERFGQRQLRLAECTQLRCGDVADNFRMR
jgi:hypothetical protein